MEQWKISVITGIALIILALAFSAVRKSFSIWMALVVVLGVVDIALGIIRKRRE
jgi:uncharacterized membrane protein